MKTPPARTRPRSSGDSTVLDIAGVRLEISCDRPLADIAFDPAYARFVSGGRPDVRLECSYTDGPLATPSGATGVFDSQGLWTLHRVGDRMVFVLEAPDDGVGPYRIASFDAALTHGEIVSRAGGKAGVVGPLMPDPLEYPLGEAVTVSLLGQGRGIMVHSCGLSVDGRGTLLVGHSGAGKSTIARLAGDDAVLMNDDRIIVRMEDGRPRMYGTPWHGDHPGVDPRGVDLERIIFIERAPAGSVEPIRGISAAAQLFARTFTPVWSADGLDFTLGLAGGITSATPCFRMGFTPDRSVLDLIRCAV